MATAPNPRARASARQRAEAKKAEDAGQDAIVLIVNGVRYPIRQSGLSPQDRRVCRKATEFSPTGIIRALREDPDLDVLAAAMWLSLYQRGELVTFDKVCEGLDDDVELDIDNQLRDGDEDPDSPEV